MYTFFIASWNEVTIKIKSSVPNIKRIDRMFAIEKTTSFHLTLCTATSQSIKIFRRI